MSRRIHVMSTVVAITVCMGLAGLASSGGTARAQPPSDSARDGAPAAVRARMRQARTAMVQARLDQAAARLEIRASQEPAWNAFTAAVKTAFAAPPAAARPIGRAGNAPEDAAALLHRMATVEAARAQNLTRLADATTRLQAALDPNQREVLDEVVRTQLRRGPGGLGFRQRRVMLRGQGPGFGPASANRQFVYRSFGPGGPGDGPARFRQRAGGGLAAPLPPPDPQAVPDPPPAPDAAPAPDPGAP